MLSTAMPLDAPALSASPASSAYGGLGTARRTLPRQFDDRQWRRA
jgi:hypothetical protein